ncbi:MAG: transglycosylase SLT domain-containing protein, partial [Gammaproteobacteria bacterium]|nr:transglycosylase SLT domain-containing protein [Gammaproteobacteria bacterium]
MKALVRYASILGLAAVLSACQSFPGSSDNDAETRHNVLTSDRLMIPAADGEGDMSSLPDDVDHQILGDLHRARQKLEHVRLNSANAEQDDDTVWARMLDLYALELEHEDPRLAHEIDRLTSKPAHFQKTLERARRYMYHIVNEIDARGLPGELALLPVVESAFDPFAYSRAHASGLWQFIPETGKLYGLEQNWWYDGRRDVVAATDAALRFLAELAEKYEGDWLLALAAYNSGPGTVSRA